MIAVTLAAPVASAGGPIKTTEPFSVSLDRLAGTICDFELFETFTGTDVIKEFNDRVEIHDSIKTTHTNVDTGYTLTESYVTNFTVYLDGSTKAVGIVFHLLDANGKIVVVQAGQLIFDPDGNIIKHTPGIDANGPSREVICPALGGNPAPRP